MSSGVSFGISICCPCETGEDEYDGRGVEELCSAVEVIPLGISLASLHVLEDYLAGWRVYSQESAAGNDPAVGKLTMLAVHELHAVCV